MSQKLVQRCYGPPGLWHEIRRKLWTKFGSGSASGSLDDSARPISSLKDCRVSGQRNSKVAENPALSVEDFVLENGLLDFRDGGERATEVGRMAHLNYNHYSSDYVSLITSCHCRYGDDYYKHSFRDIGDARRFRFMMSLTTYLWLVGNGRMVV